VLGRAIITSVDLMIARPSTTAKKR